MCLSVYVLIGCLVVCVFGGGNTKEKVHIKVVVPKLIHHHHHTKTIVFHDHEKPKEKPSHGHGHHFYHHHHNFHHHHSSGEHHHKGEKPHVHVHKVHKKGKPHHHHPTHHKPTHHKPTHHKPTHHKPSHHKPTHHKPTHHKPAHHKPTHHTPAHHHPTHHHPTHHHPTHHKPTHHKPADHKPSHDNPSHKSALLAQLLAHPNGLNVVHQHRYTLTPSYGPPSQPLFNPNTESITPHPDTELIDPKLRSEDLSYLIGSGYEVEEHNPYDPTPAPFKASLKSPGHVDEGGGEVGEYDDPEKIAEYISFIQKGFHDEQDADFGSDHGSEYDKYTDGDYLEANEHAGSEFEKYKNHLEDGEKEGYKYHDDYESYEKVDSSHKSK